MQKSYRIGVEEAGELASKLASGLAGNEIFGLIGDLGSGKTTFVKALGRALGIKRRITSPTFILLQKFSFKVKGLKRPWALVHLDAYRTRSGREITLLGLDELWGKKGVITVIEWADKIKTILPKKTISIYFNAKKKHK